MIVVSVEGGAIGELHDASQLVTLRARRDVLADESFDEAGNLSLQRADLPDDVLLLIGSLHVVGFTPPHGILLTIVVQLCASVILEIVLRGILFRQVERLLGTWFTLLAAMICFGVIPLFGTGGAPLAVLADAIDAGLIFSAMFIVTRRLWAAIGLHVAWFFAQIGLNGVPSIAGGPREFVLTRTVGPEWLTGGNAGTYTSAPALLISGLLVAALLAVAVRRRQIVRPAWRRGRAG